MRRRSAPSRMPSITSTSGRPSESRPGSGRTAGHVRPAEAFAERLGLAVRDLDLLEQALVHSSWHHEHRDGARGHNERLEFLGDAVVNLAISQALYARHPADNEGYLSARRAAIVSTVGLARLAGRIELGGYLMLGEGEAQRSGRRRPSLLASTFEAGSKNTPSAIPANGPRTACSTPPAPITRSRSGSRSGWTASCSGPARGRHGGQPRRRPRRRRWSGCA
jgi:hypothetical protein